MASDSPMPIRTAHDASDEDYCGSWQQLLNLHQRRIALWQPEGLSTAQAHTGCPSSLPTAPTRRPPEALAPTGCPTSSRPTSSQCPAASVTALPTAASVTALPTAHAPPSELLYSTRAPGPDSRASLDAQLSSILQDVALMQDLLTYQHNQLRAQEIHSRLLGGQAEQFKHSLAVCNSLLNSALTQAHVAYARLNEDLWLRISWPTRFGLRPNFSASAPRWSPCLHSSTSPDVWQLCPTMPISPPSEPSKCRQINGQKPTPLPGYAAKSFA